MFAIYSRAHWPLHVHALVGSTTIILDLRLDGTVQLSERNNAVEPKNAKDSDVRKALRAARDNASALRDLWEATHGK